jgi:CheY-like chemotaxis protein
MSGKKLLVADDSLTIQKVIRLALSQEGYEIQTVSEGNEAIEQILLFRPKLVLIDVTLPGKSAIEVKAAIDSKPDLAGTQFVLMSSAFETVDESSIEKAGFSGRLTKPFDPAHLRKLVSEGFESAGVAMASPPPPPPLQVPPVEVPTLSLAAATPPADPIWEPPTLTPPALQAGALGSSESDIRELTQSTLKMAGLDDLDWSVSEPTKKDSELPGMAPIPALPPFGSLSAPSLSPPSAMMASMGSDATSAYFNAHIESDLPPPVPSQPQPTESYALPTDELEALVQQQVEAALQKISRELLPQMAERIIKQEINRLLNEVP